MNYRLAIVGRISSIGDIKKIISESFDNVETHGVELGNDEMADQAVAALQALLPQLDGVLYTRSDPYKLIVSRLDHGTVSARYADIDATSLVKCLLVAEHHMKSDIRSISVDTPDCETVMRKNNGSFMTAELMDELHISFRTAARIVEKLEQNGYLVEIGRSVISGRGRPTRLFRLLW